MTTDKFTDKRTDLPIIGRQNYPMVGNEHQKDGQNYPLISILKKHLLAREKAGAQSIVHFIVLSGLHFGGMIEC